ncbi:MAG TPA: DUF1007 family protein [Candidatus Binatia bacterium]|nr:DUF1007 family protein [Candidatus Binatia bacterium]
MVNQVRLLHALLPAVLAGMLLAGDAAAHPHVFIDASVEVVFGSPGFTGVRVTWAFDDLFSSTILTSFERDGSGGFSPAGIKEIEERHLESFRSFGYFLDITANGSPVPVASVKDFRVRVDKAQVIYAFTAVVTPPAEPQGALAIVVDDPTFYSAFAVVEPVRVQVAAEYQAECRLARDAATNRPEGIACTYRRRSG